jgi:O-antigen/teichoic acid export membrane protein
MGLIATHYLLPKELGEYAIFYAAFSLAAIIPATLIYTPIEVRTLELPLDRRLSVLRKSAPLGGITGLVSGLIVTGLVVPLVPQVGIGVRLEFAGTVAAVSCVSPVQDHLRRMFHQSGRSWIAARISVIQFVTVAVVIILARIVAVPLPLVPFGALVIGNLASGVVGYRAARVEPGYSPLRGQKTTDIIRGGGWLTVGTAYGFVAGLATVTILAERSGAAAAGQTEAARVLSQPVTVIAVGILAVFGPEMMSAAQRGQSKTVNRMMAGFLGVVVVATLLWLAAVGTPRPWSPITRIFSTAYEVSGLMALTVVQQALAYGSLAYRSVIIATGDGRKVGKLDMFAYTAIILGVYVMAPYLGAFSILWAFLGSDLLLFWWRARMASRAIRAAGAGLECPLNRAPTAL